jgi:hypothetical protein
MASVTPVIICITKQKANNEPKFHRKLRLDGCGESTTYELTNFSKGWLLKILILII